MSGRLPKHIREILAEAQRMAAAAGLESHLEQSRGHGHARIVLVGRGQTRFKPVSGTPKNAGDAVRLALRDVRRLILEMTAGDNPVTAGILAAPHRHAALPAGGRL